MTIRSARPATSIRTTSYRLLTMTRLWSASPTSNSAPANNTIWQPSQKLPTHTGRCSSSTRPSPRACCPSTPPLWALMLRFQPPTSGCADHFVVVDEQNSFVTRVFRRFEYAHGSTPSWYQLQRPIGILEYLIERVDECRAISTVQETMVKCQCSGHNRAGTELAINHSRPLRYA